MTAPADDRFTKTLSLFLASLEKKKRKEDEGKKERKNNKENGEKEEVKWK